jgi:arsenite methyltransferase
MSGLTFSDDAAENLIAAYRTPDLVQQREATLQRLNLKRGERVVDIGCGPGFLCENMAAAISDSLKSITSESSPSLSASEDYERAVADYSNCVLDHTANLNACEKQRAACRGGC